MHMTLRPTLFALGIAGALLAACAPAEEELTETPDNTGANVVASNLLLEVDEGKTTVKPGNLPPPSRGSRPVLSGAPPTLAIDRGEKTLFLYTVDGESPPKKLFVKVRGSDSYYEIELPDMTPKADGPHRIVLKSEVDMPDESDAEEDYCTDTSVEDGEGQVSDPEETCVETDEDASDEDVVGEGEEEPEPLDDGSARVCFYPFVNRYRTLYVDAEGKQYRNSAVAISKTETEDEDPEDDIPPPYVVTYQVETFPFSGQVSLLIDEAGMTIYDIGSVGTVGDEYINNSYSPGIPVPFALFPGQTLVQSINKTFVDETGQTRNTNFTYTITHTGRSAYGCTFVAQIGDTVHTRTFAFESGALVYEKVEYQGKVYSEYDLVGGTVDDEWLDAGYY